MAFSIRLVRRFPVQCSVTYYAGRLLKLPLAYCSGFWLLIMLLVLNSGPAYAEWVPVSVVDQAGVTICRFSHHSSQRESSNDVGIDRL